MSGSISGIRSAINTALDTISGLRTFNTVPETINEFPAAFVRPQSGAYDYDVGGDMVHKFEIVLLVRRWGDVDESQDTLDPYCDESGTYSIKAAVDAATLSTYASAIRVTGFRDYGAIEFAGIFYVGAKFDVDVIT